ncbi:hypothetical protein SVIOM342S_04016 [Streptomyces violaceorubidus]
MATVSVNEIALGIESFGDDDAPLVLLVGGTTMLSWPDALCERLAAGGRRVVRYDLRDSGESTTADPEAPTYTLRDQPPTRPRYPRRSVLLAHLAGIGVGRMVAQVAALDHPARSRRSRWPAPAPSRPARRTTTFPTTTWATMRRLFARPKPDWTHREAVAEFAATGAEVLGNDPAAARATAARVWDDARHRRPGPDGQPAGHGVLQARLRTPFDVSARPRSRSPRSSSTDAATRASPSATARRSRARFPGPGCSCWRRPPPRSPRRRSARSPRRCLRSAAGRAERDGTPSRRTWACTNARAHV